MMKLPKKREVASMGTVKRIVLDRYEHGLLVRVLYEEWKQMQAAGAPSDGIEDLLLKVIDAPQASFLARLLA